MHCYFYCLQSHFIDYIDDLVLDGAVICAGDVPFQYNEQEGTYTEFLVNPTGNVFLATSGEFLLSHILNMSNILNNSIKLIKK